MFTPRRVNGLEPKIREYCATRLDPTVGTGTFDFIHDLGAYMPMRTIGMLLGIPEADQEALRERIDKGLELESSEMPDMLEKMANGVAQSEIFGDYVDWRMQNPSDDLMTELLNGEYEDIDGERKKLTREEVLNFINLLSGAGNETTTRLIGWTGKTLAEHPDQLRAVVEDRDLVPKVIEEVLRYEAPSPVQARFVTHDVELHGQTVPEGSAMVVINGSGQPRRPPLRRRRLVRHPPHHRPPPLLRVRHPLLPGRGARSPRGAHRPRRGPQPLPRRLGGRLDNATQARTSTVRGWQTLPVVTR